MTILADRPLLAAVTCEGLQALRALPAKDLPALAGEIRSFLIEHVGRTGGHLGPNLGMVEVTVALHRVFNSPSDVILFDIGHQAYVHKILTGRANEFGSLRQFDGLSGYLCRDESPHDVIENSHASTAVSYADGVSKALYLRGETHRRVIAVIGDGALTGGMAFEAINNLAAVPERAVIVVLNDNGRSYAPTMGGIGAHLRRLQTAETVHTPNLFENLGLAYAGPIDGHDLAAVEEALRQAEMLGKSVVVHVITDKGKGYPPAEADDADCFHAVGVIDTVTGRPATHPRRSWTDVFGEEITEIGLERPDIVCLTAAMLLPAGLGPFAAAFPDRVFDVGIAEQHAVTCAAGLALGGMHPVVAIYSTFINRAFDQLMMDVALLNLPVTFVLDRAGITGPDGASHHGMWDASLLPLVPGLRLACPRDPAQLRELLREAIAHDGPTVVRYPKSAVGSDIAALSREEHCDILYAAADPQVLLIAVGPLADMCLDAAAELAVRGIGVTVIDPRWTAPLDSDLLHEAAGYRLVLTIEDTTTTGALGARLAQALAAIGSSTCAATVALPAAFLSQGTREEVLAEHGLHAEGIVDTVAKYLELLGDATHPIVDSPSRMALR